MHFLNDDLRFVLIDLAAYTPNFTTNEFLSSVPEAARISEVVLTAKTVGTPTDGTFDAADPVFENVTGPTSEAVILYKAIQTAGVIDPAASPLIAYFDTAPGLPVTPSVNPGPIRVTLSTSGLLRI